MAELCASSIPQDVQKITGMNFDGMWDELVMPGLKPTFQRIEDKISQILAEADFQERERIEANGKRAIVYGGRGDSSCVIDVKEIMPNSVWKYSRITGYGSSEIICPVLDSIEKFYTEEVGFNVERK